MDHDREPFMGHRFGHPWAGGHPMLPVDGGWPGMLISMLGTLFWVILLIGLVWALLKWISPYILPMISTMPGMAAEGPSALEILRQRYATGEIDANMFEQMRERLQASYQQEEREASNLFGERLEASYQQEREEASQFGERLELPYQ